MEALKISLTLLLLVPFFLFLERLVFLLNSVIFLFISSLHISSLLLDFLHLVVTLKLFIFALTIQILLFLPVFEDEGIPLLLSISLFSLDRFFQIADFVL